jgi:hypothetical protein
MKDRSQAKSKIAIMTSGTELPPAKPANDLAEFSIATMAGLSLALASMLICVVTLAGDVASARDFVVFWATGQQLIHHANPYDAAAMMRIEHTAGLNKGYGSLYMRNPPFALPLALPLGLVGLRIGALLWSLILAACLVVSGWLMWLMHGRPAGRIHWLAYSFAPALICLFIGQTALFSLLGLTLFLRLYRERPFMAGLSLWLCALKPHLFLPFGVVLLVWIVLSRSYKIVAGALVALATSSALAYLLDPTAWRDYAQMMQAPGIAKEFIPCLSDAMRLWLSPQTIWLQYLPAAVACAWALVYFWRRRIAWDWMRDGSLLMLVSILTAPYCWLYDQAVLIPALLQGAYVTRYRPLLAVLALASLPVEIGLMAGVKITSPLYLWAAPGWFAWYLFARAYSGQSKASEQTQPAV